jgi:hypothetical protein
MRGGNGLRSLRSLRANARRHFPPTMVPRKVSSLSLPPLAPSFSPAFPAIPQPRERRPVLHRVKPAPSRAVPRVAPSNRRTVIYGACSCGCVHYAPRHAHNQRAARGPLVESQSGSPPRALHPLTPARAKICCLTLRKCRSRGAIRAARYAQPPQRIR